MKQYIFSLFMVLSLGVFAQTDSTSIAGTLNDAQNVINMFPTLPEWFYTALIIIGATLSATQTILKQFPTDKSVKIGGVIGKILDVLTWFSKDNKTGGGTH